MEVVLQCRDLDYDGELSGEELKRWLGKRNEPEWIIKIVPEHDKNHDGKLDKGEIKDFMKTIAKKYFEEMAPVEEIRIFLQVLY